jgi:soluble lytic murein transglycosylase-like protein
MTTRAQLHHDVHTLKTAEAHERKDAGALKHDEGALKHDHRALQREHDRMHKDGKELTKQKHALGGVRKQESQKLAPLEQQRTAAQNAYNASVDPLTGMGDPALQMKVGALDQKIADVHASLDPRVNKDAAAVSGTMADRERLSRAIAANRADAQKEKKAVKHDHSAVSRDQHAVKNDKARVANDRGVPNVVGGQVGSWIAQAQTILKQHGIPLSKMNARDIALIIQHESSGNPNAVNNWDSNAAAGTPSEGLMQTIGPTFNSYKLKGHNHILNPVDNIIAGVRYAISRYGSISNVPGVVAVHQGGSYVGY